MRSDLPRSARAARRPPPPPRGTAGGRRGGRRSDAAAPSAPGSPRAPAGWLARLRERVQTWLLRNLQSLVGTLGQLARTPLGSLMTVAVLGVALALPLGLQIVLKNVGAVTSQWNFRADVSVYLTPGLGEDATDAVVERLQRDERIAEVALIPPAEGLETLGRQAGLEALVEDLEENPLPTVVVLTPAAGPDMAPERLRALADSLGDLDGVDLVRVDLEWIRRLQGLMALGRTLALLAAVVLSVAMLLVVGNAVRLEIAGRQDEILVSKLIGATNAFVRRPFVYLGFWYGLGGGLLALTLVSVVLALLGNPVARLAAAYDTDFTLAGPSPAEALVTLGAAAILGAVSAWVAAALTLRRVEPN